MKFKVNNVKVYDISISLKNFKQKLKNIQFKNETRQEEGLNECSSRIDVNIFEF